MRSIILLHALFWLSGCSCDGSDALSMLDASRDAGMDGSDGIDAGTTDAALPVATDCVLERIGTGSVCGGRSDCPVLEVVDVTCPGVSYALQVERSGTRTHLGLTTDGWVTRAASVRVDVAADDAVPHTFEGGFGFQLDSRGDVVKFQFRQSTDGGVWFLHADRAEASSDDAGVASAAIEIRGEPWGAGLDGQDVVHAFGRELDRSGTTHSYFHSRADRDEVELVVGGVELLDVNVARRDGASPALVFVERERSADRLQMWTEEAGVVELFASLPGPGQWGPGSSPVPSGIETIPHSNAVRLLVTREERIGLTAYGLADEPSEIGDWGWPAPPPCNGSQYTVHAPDYCSDAAANVDAGDQLRAHRLGRDETGSVWLLTMSGHGSIVCRDIAFTACIEDRDCMCGAQLEASVDVRRLTVQSLTDPTKTFSWPVPAQGDQDLSHIAVSHGGGPLTAAVAWVDGNYGAKQTHVRYFVLDAAAL